VLGLVLGTGFLVLLWESVDMAAVGALLARAALLPLLFGLAAYTADFCLRAVRFWLLLDGRERAIPVGATISPFIASFGISDILPFRLGDAFRVFWFHRNLNLPMGTVLGAMILERMLDLVTIVLLAGLALHAVDTAVSGPIMDQIRIVLTVAAVAGIAILLSPMLLDRLAALLTRTGGAALRRLSGLLRSVAETIRLAGTLRRMSGLILFSLGIWLLESLVILGAWASLGGAARDALRPFFAFTISTLGTLVPALPGHFGSYEYFGVLSFDAVGVDRTMAAAVILLSHLMLWLPTALYGVGWLLAWRGKEPFPLRTAP
jgi:uncharacterized protein (TIRG00374 family)